MWILHVQCSVPPAAPGAMTTVTTAQERSRGSIHKFKMYQQLGMCPNLPLANLNVPAPVSAMFTNRCSPPSLWMTSSTVFNSSSCRGKRPAAIVPSEEKLGRSATGGAGRRFVVHDVTNNWRHRAKFVNKGNGRFMFHPLDSMDAIPPVLCR